MRSVRTLISLTPEERAALDEQAARWGTSLARTVGHLALGTRPPEVEPPTPDQALVEALVEAAGTLRAAAGLLECDEDLLGRWRRGARPLPDHRRQQIRSVLGSAEDGP